jgi:hypothetical protein
MYRFIEEEKKERIDDCIKEEVKNKRQREKQRKRRSS